MFGCTCPASRGLQGRICGVNHPNCHALAALSSAAPGVVVSPTSGAAGADPRPR
ncbi:hypothetical protein ACFQU7_37075 [Pseudoroseomonas wenyumeiae]